MSYAKCYVQGVTTVARLTVYNHLVSKAEVGIDNRRRLSQPFIKFIYRLYIAMEHAQNSSTLRPRFTTALIFFFLSCCRHNYRCHFRYTYILCILIVISQVMLLLITRMLLNKDVLINHVCASIMLNCACKLQSVKYINKTRQKFDK